MTHTGVGPSGGGGFGAGFHIVAVDPPEGASHVGAPIAGQALLRNGGIKGNLLVKNRNQLIQGSIFGEIQNPPDVQTVVIRFWLAVCRFL